MTISSNHAMSQSRFAKRYKFVSEQKAGGATYTPSNLADFVARQIVAVADIQPRERLLRVLDPAVGDGALLISLVNELAKHTAINVEVYGFDTNEQAVVEARARIVSMHPKVAVRLEVGNFLEYVLTQPSLTRGASLFAPSKSETFDLIIANPPYVRTQIMGAQQAQGLAAAFGLTGRVDLYHAFLVGMALVLSRDGTAGIIVSNRFMTTRGGASIRRALRQHLALRHIWDLGDTKLFEAAVLPAVIIANGMNNSDQAAPAFTSIYETNVPSSFHATDPIGALAHTGVVALPDGRSFNVQHGVLASSAPEQPWSMANATKDAWHRTVMAHSWGTFRDIGKVRVGVKTCADPIFIRDDWH